MEVGAPVLGIFLERYLWETSYKDVNYVRIYFIATDSFVPQMAGTLVTGLFDPCQIIRVIDLDEDEQVLLALAYL